MLIISITNRKKVIIINLGKIYYEEIISDIRILLVWMYITTMWLEIVLNRKIPHYSWQNIVIFKKQGITK